MSDQFSFQKLFLLLGSAFLAVFVAGVLHAWTGPTAVAPAEAIPLPITTLAVDQIKNAGLSVNALAVFGIEYIQYKLGVGVPFPTVAADVNGTIKIANGGETCSAATAGGLRYNSATKKVEYCNGGAWIAL